MQITGKTNPFFNIHSATETAVLSYIINLLRKREKHYEKEALCIYCQVHFSTFPHKISYLNKK